ncbi:MAG: pyridoxamine 5'-phosphate oxidase family protein [Verrucomicrobia bacterium]|nr:pyridoxamine 5'-phosphate oxidase family protein [Verrucomicrobiota bacterium]
MTLRDVLSFLRQHRLAVQASVSKEGVPQAAVVGFAISDTFELVFDTLESTRKILNLRSNPNCALVIGGLTAGDERTVQCEGVADEPSGAELERLAEVYYQVFPEGRVRRTWAGLTYVRVRLTWLRYSDYNVERPEVVEFSGSLPTTH